jgi:hypothetical protein
VHRSAKSREVEGAQEEAVDSAGSGEDAGGVAGDDEDGPWYLGRAREEFHRRRRGQPAGEEEDPIEVNGRALTAPPTHNTHARTHTDILHFLVGKGSQKCGTRAGWRV